MSDKLNELWLAKVKINQIMKKDQPKKGKPALWVEFKCQHTGRICSMRFGLPFKTFDLFQLADLTSVLKGSQIRADSLKGIDPNKATIALDKFVGKELIALIQPVDLGEKTFWTVKQTFDVKYWNMALERASTGDSNVSNNDPFSDISNPFGSSQGDDIPF